MAQFSYVNMDTAQAQRLNEVNYDMILDDIVRGRAKIVALTTHDWGLLQMDGDVDALRTVLAAQYTLVLEQADFGQGGNTLFIYKRR